MVESGKVVPPKYSATTLLLEEEDSIQERISLACCSTSKIVGTKKRTILDSPSIDSAAINVLPAPVGRTTTELANFTASTMRF